METPIWIHTLETLPDPRSRVDRYSLPEILLLVLAGILSGQKDMVSIEMWGQTQLEWLRKYQPYADGIPSHDTLSRVLGRLRTDCVQTLLMKVVPPLIREPKPEATDEAEEGDRHLAVDGKVLRGSASRAGNPQRPQHAVHVWDVVAKRLLGLGWVDIKSNEITAFPGLLASLDLTDTVVTIDAMGAHLPLVQQVVASGGGCVIGLKGNQSNLLDDTLTLFTQPPRGVKTDVHEISEKDHGRVETRITTVMGLTPEMAANLQNPDWPLRSVVRVQSTRAIQDKVSQETRYYLSTLPIETHGARRQAHLIRQHWSVESFHHTLDVAFAEDSWQTREARLVKNLAVLRRVAQTILAQDTAKLGVAKKMLKFGYDLKHRTAVIGQWARSLAPVAPKRVYQALRGPVA